MKNHNRRNFLKQISATALLPGTLTPPLIQAESRSNDVDVVVVGAGAAGLAATDVLRSNGRSVLLLEASNRIGGRVTTDLNMFGVPYDRGAHWIHNGLGNPLFAYGKENGFDLYSAPDDDILYIGSREADKSEQETFEKEFDRAVRAIGKAGSRGRDVSPSEVVPNGSEWHDTVHLNIGPYEMAKDYDHFSCKDWWNSDDGQDAYCKQGYGALLGHRVRDIRAELGHTVESIDWQGKGVTVHTNQGAIKAAKCIVTTSTGVLANDAIRFVPELPVAKQESFHGISMGIYNHLALQFSHNIFGIGDDGYVLYKLDSKGANSPRGMSLLVNISGSNLSFGDVGGEFARELEREGVAGGVDFALSELRKIFGTDVDKAFIKGDATRWGSDQLFFGSYASAEPGAFGMRRELRKPIAEKLFFAGEACHASAWATVHGAFESGARQGARVNNLFSD